MISFSEIVRKEPSATASRLAGPDEPRSTAPSLKGSYKFGCIPILSSFQVICNSVTFLVLSPTAAFSPCKDLCAYPSPAACLGPIVGLWTRIISVETQYDIDDILLICDFSHADILISVNVWMISLHWPFSGQPAVPDRPSSGQRAASHRPSSGQPAASDRQSSGQPAAPDTGRQKDKWIVNASLV